MTVSSSTNKVSYSGNGTLTTFAYTFKIFDQDDLTVILRAADGTETTQTITTHYTVTGVGEASGGNVVFGSAPASGVTVVIIREQPLTQGLDLVPNTAFPAESLEEALDKLTFMSQKHEEELGRAIKASRTNTLTGSEFTVSATERANKIFAFDASGDLSVTQELGTFKGNWGASTAYVPRDIVKDTSTNNIFIANTAHTSSGSQPLTSNTDSAKWDLLVDAASATTAQTAAASSATAAATSATASETAKTAAETAKTAAETAKTSAETAFDNLDDRYLGAKSSDPSTDNDGDALITGALYFNTTDGEMKVFNGSAFITITVASSNQANINAVAGNATNINSVAAKSSLITSDFVSDLNTVATTAVIEDLNILATSDIVSDLNTLATSDIVSDINTLATSDIVSDLNTLATSDIVSDINTLATSDIVSDLNTLATSDFVSDLNTIATTTNVNNIATVAGANSNITTVATNISGVNSFADRYRVGSSDPTSSLDEGDLAYNSTANVLKYYNGSAWVSISAGIADVSSDTSPQLGGNLDMNGQDIVTTSNADIDLAPNGTGRVVVKGNTNQGSIVLNCENNSHGITIQSAPHSAGASYTVKLPDALGTTSASAFVTTDASGVATFAGDVVAPRFVDSASSSYYLDPFGTSVLAYSYLQQTFALNSALTGTTPTCTASTHSSFSLTTSGNTTFTFSVGAIGTGYLIGFVLKLTSGGSHTITWPNTVDWAGGSAPDAPASGETDILVFTSIDAGTNWYGARVIDAAA